ncbi:MAG: T9SS type A sorting domain-containing protein, partial [Hymenobacteraceae bacterium]|nr:T9SS type A sorting domain-containing protein [Hymenobacteraceae bacterium]
TVNAGQDAEIKLQLVNLTGQTVWSKSVNVAQGVTTVDLADAANLPKGMYLLTAEHAGVLYQQKLVRQ